MIITGELIIDSLSEDYSSPNCKLGRMVERGEIVRVRRGLYETDPDTEPYFLAHHICEPSYISFEYALSWYEIIPEGVVNITCATCGKRKTKTYDTPFGFYIYYDIPSAAFHEGIVTHHQDDREFLLASREKAVCDKLYKMPPVRGRRNLEALMYEDLRFDEDGILDLDLETIKRYADLYRCTTLHTLVDYLAVVG